MPTLNRPLVERIIAQLEEHPETHNQGAFGSRTECRTTHCIAGWAAKLSPGTKLIWQGRMLDGVVMPDGSTLHPEVAGAELLGLPPTAAYAPYMGSGPRALFYDFGDTDHMVGRLRELLAADSEGGN